MKKIKNPTTEQAKELLDYNFTKIELCKELGITRPTLDARLSGKSDWKVLEVKWIDLLSEAKGMDVICTLESIKMH